MDLSRRIGIGIVMLVPTYVGAGALWAMFHNWFVIFGWVVVMFAVGGAVISGRFLKSWESEEFRFA